MDQDTNNPTQNAKTAKGLITELGLDGLPEKEKNEMVVKLSESLQNRITVRIASALSNEQQAAIDKLIEQGEDEKVGEYLSKSIPGLDLIMRDEYEQFREEILSENQALLDRIKNIEAKGSPDKTGE